LGKFAENVLAKGRKFRRNLGLDFRKPLDAGSQEGFARRVIEGSHARHSFAEQKLAFAHPDYLVDHRDRSGLV
jgi:hypothetical protein